jgi:3-isopropylmalate dehydrogenase
MPYKTIILAGDGVGPEVTAEAVRVLEWFAHDRDLPVLLDPRPFGIDTYRQAGELISQSTLDDIKSADAVLFGATGGPEYDTIPLEVRRQGSLLRLRRELGVYANLRPIRGYPALGAASALRSERIDGVDIVIVRELTGGLYFGQPRGIDDGPGNEETAVNTLTYRTSEIERVARAAFELARRRDGRLTSVDKSNVLENGVLWRRVVSKIGAEEFPDVALDHILIDNCAMQLAAQPAQFDVLLADNMFGDILSDIGGAIAGSLGMLPSASLRGSEGRGAIYEPVHGSAPDIAGKGIANPLGAILSVEMLIRYTLAMPDEADLLLQAVENVVAQGVRTADIAPAGMVPVATAVMGDAVLEQLQDLSD